MKKFFHFQKKISIFRQLDLLKQFQNLVMYQEDNEKYQPLRQDQPLIMLVEVLYVLFVQHIPSMKYLLESEIEMKKLFVFLNIMKN